MDNTNKVSFRAALGSRATVHVVEITEAVLIKKGTAWPSSADLVFKDSDGCVRVFSISNMRGRKTPESIAAVSKVAARVMSAFGLVDLDEVQRKKAERHRETEERHEQQRCSELASVLKRLGDQPTPEQHERMKKAGVKWDDENV